MISVANIQIWLTRDKNIKYFTWGTLYLLLIHSDWCSSVMLIRKHATSSMAKFNILFCWLQHMYLNTTTDSSLLFIRGNDLNILYCSQRLMYLNNTNKIELIFVNKIKIFLFQFFWICYTGLHHWYQCVPPHVWKTFVIVIYIFFIYMKPIF